MFKSKLCESSWISTLKNVFRVTFKKIDKGWFNMKETSMDAYKASKMKRYLTMVQLMMEDSLRYLVEDALQKYTCFVEQHIGSAHIDIKSINEVICEWPKLTYSHVSKGFTTQRQFCGLTFWKSSTKS